MLRMIFRGIIVSVVVTVATEVIMETYHKNEGKIKREANKIKERLKNLKHRNIIIVESE